MISTIYRRGSIFLFLKKTLCCISLPSSGFPLSCVSPCFHLFSVSPSTFSVFQRCWMKRPWSICSSDLFKFSGYWGKVLQCFLDYLLHPRIHWSVLHQRKGAKTVPQTALKPTLRCSDKIWFLCKHSWRIYKMSCLDYFSLLCLVLYCSLYDWLQQELRCIISATGNKCLADKDFLSLVKLLM